jgi:hypothetical protein
VDTLGDQAGTADPGSNHLATNFADDVAVAHDDLSPDDRRHRRAFRRRAVERVHMVHAVEVVIADRAFLTQVSDREIAVGANRDCPLLRVHVPRIRRSLGTRGRPSAGRPNVVDTNHVRVRLLFAPVDGRGDNAIWPQYLTESFVLDLDLTNERPFRPTRETYEHIDLLTAPPPGGRVFEPWNREQLFAEIGTRVDQIELLLLAEPTLPRPAVTFRDGPVWAADKVSHWLASNHSAAVGQG